MLLTMTFYHSQQPLNVKNITSQSMCSWAEPYACFKERDKHSKFYTETVVYSKVSSPILKRMKFRHSIKLLFKFMQ